MRLKLQQIHFQGDPPAWRLRGIALKCIGALRKSGKLPSRAVVSLSVSCVGANEMIRLNARFRGKRSATDVLSFESRAPGPGNVLFLGDLVLCAPVVRAQARRFGHGVQEELAILLAHGFLHLLGYDHERSATDAARMARAEAELLKGIGLGRLAQNNSGLIARAELGNGHG